MDFQGKRATIMGLGRFGGGVAAARWLARRGAVVTVTDLADEIALADSLRVLKDVPIAACHLGGHREVDFRDADLVVVNPAVRPGNPMLQIAHQAGVRRTSEIELFMEACPARCVGVTGSNGKSTTAAMTAAILRAAGDKVYLGGNIGNSLLSDLDRIGPDDRVVLELSSFQLWHLGPDARMPQVAVVTGCSPNHLDWHGTFEHYAAAKQRILLGQTADDLAVLSDFDPEVSTWTACLRGRQIALERVERIPPLRVPGRHNLINAACATAAAHAAGCDSEAIRQGLESFQGLPQRLEWCAEIDGRRFCNDTTATTPESTIAALESLKGRVWLLAGGREKGCDFEPLVATIAEKVQGAAFFGTVAEQLRDRVAGRSATTLCTAVETMDDALRWCWERSAPGDVILLSPACSSGDQFRNFRERGERFVALVQALTS